MDVPVLLPAAEPEALAEAELADWATLPALIAALMAEDAADRVSARDAACAAADACQTGQECRSNP